MTPETFGKITLYNGDCMDYLRTLPDNAFEISVVDPPYSKANGKVERTGGTWASKYGKTIKQWDESPPQFILLNYKELVKIKLFGAAIISHCRRQEALSYGVN